MNITNCSRTCSTAAYKHIHVFQDFLLSLMPYIARSSKKY